jgi:hypothetical protein
VRQAEPHLVVPARLQAVVPQARLVAQVLSPAWVRLVSRPQDWLQEHPARSEPRSVWLRAEELLRQSAFRQSEQPAKDWARQQALLRTARASLPQVLQALEQQPAGEPPILPPLLSPRVRILRGLPRPLHPATARAPLLQLPRESSWSGSSSLLRQTPAAGQ